MKTLISIAVISGLALLLWAALRIEESIFFANQCGGHQQRAAYASSIDAALAELDYVESYMGHWRLNTGHTSLFYRTHDEDIGFWHSNVIGAINELRVAKKSGSPLVHSSVLLKLRESLMQRSWGWEVARVPAGISIYPSNALFFWWAFVWSGLLLVSGGRVWMNYFQNKRK